jgi:hypothetical protein
VLMKCAICGGIARERRGCGAGAPCPKCNASDADTSDVMRTAFDKRPAPLIDARTIAEVDAARYEVKALCGKCGSLCRTRSPALALAARLR